MTATFVCPNCGHTRQALAGCEIAHPCPMSKRGTSRLVRLVEQEGVADVT